MIRVELDLKGRLILFEAIPPQVFIPAANAAPAMDWNPLFSAAELDVTQFQPAKPTWNSLSASDTRAAWTGKWPGTDRALRIEAAAFQGKPVFFRLVGDWTEPSRVPPPPESSWKKAVGIVSTLLVIALIVGALTLARRNYRQGRGDRLGALLLAKIFFGVLMLLWLLQGHFVPGLGVISLMVLAISTALFLSGVIFILYLALEPYVRRYWPQAIISWSRLLAGRTRDPLVGRDILFGVALGVLWIVVFRIGELVSIKMGADPALFSTSYLLDARRALGAWAAQLPFAIFATLQFFFFFLVLKIVLKRDWLATTVFVAIFVAIKSIGSNYLAVTVTTSIVVYLILALIVFRFGLVPLACAIFTVDLLANVPFTADFSAWYFGTSAFALLSVLALAVWGFYFSLGTETLSKTNE